MKKYFIQSGNRQQKNSVIYRKYFLKATAWLKSHAVPQYLSPFIQLVSFPVKYQTFYPNHRMPLLLENGDWNISQRQFVLEHIFSTFDANNFLHNMHIASAPKVYLLEIETTKENIALDFTPLQHAHIIVHIKRAKKVTIMERRGKRSSVFETSGIEIFQDSGTLQYMYIQDSSVREKAILRHADCKPHTTLQWHMHLLGGNATYNEVQTRGHDFETSLFGTYVSYHKERLHMDYNARHTNSPGGTSNIIVRGIGLDRSYSNFRGNIHIEQQGAKTVAKLQENCLLFSKNAKHVTMPTLEIHTDDVIASHSASTTEIDSNYLFYMGTRGIHKEKAKKMILASFLAEVMEPLPLQTEKERLHHYIDRLYIHA